MRKHGNRGSLTLASRFWIDWVLESSRSRKKTQLSFETGRKICHWSTGSGRRRLTKI